MATDSEVQEIFHDVMTMFKEHNLTSDERYSIIGALISETIVNNKQLAPQPRHVVEVMHNIQMLVELNLKDAFFYYHHTRKW